MNDTGLQLKYEYVKISSIDELQAVLPQWEYSGNENVFPNIVFSNIKFSENDILLKITFELFKVSISELLLAYTVLQKACADTLTVLDTEGLYLPVYSLYRGRYVNHYGFNLNANRSRCLLYCNSNHYFYDKFAHKIEVEKYPDDIADRILKPLEAYPERQRRNFDDIQRVSRILELKAGRRLLDVGCSDGTITFMISHKWNCQEVYGVDINRSLIYKANSTLATMPDLQGIVNFQTDFIEDIEFPNEYFDTISACETLEHIGLNQLEKAIKNLVRMLKPTGNMIITVPNRCLAHKYISEYRERWRYPTHYQFFNQFTLTYHLSPYFKTIEFIPLYDEDSTNEGIFLICQCTGKK